MKALAVIVAFGVWCGVAHGDSSIVATVGPYTITAEDLLTSFEFGPAFVRRHHDPLRTHLKYMVYERLLATEGAANGLLHSRFVQDRIKALEEDGAVEQLYRTEILSHVKLPDEQIERDIKKAKMTVSLRWIYAPTKNEADRCLQVIRHGASFDSLFVVQFDSGIQSDARSLETSLLKLERDNPDFFRGIEGLEAGETSRPIQGKDGYYIVRLDNVWQNPITTESDYVRLRQQAVDIRTKIASAELADAYVKNIMKQFNPVIKAEGFNILRAYIADKGLSRDAKVKWEIPSTFMTEAGPQPIGNSEEYLHKPLVTYGGRSMTIRDYILWYDIRQFQFDTRSLTAFNSSVKKTIWKMVQDKLLSEEAYRRGLERASHVKHETEKWEAKMLYLAQRSALLRTIIVSDSAVRSFFSAHRHKYNDGKKTAAGFEKIQQAVTEDYYDEQESRLLLQSIDSLSKKYPVSINEQVLSALARQIPPDPHAIEMIFYKPGGTFPRVAFPTIDEAWGRLQ